MSSPSERTAFTTPTLLSLKELEETTNATYTRNISTTPSSWIPLQTPYYIRTALLFLVAATSATVAFSGVVVLGYLLATQSLTPRQLWYSSPLQLDLAGRELISSASMLPLLQKGGGGLPTTTTNPASKTSPPTDIKTDLNSRFLPPGQRMDVWLDFTVPTLGDGDKNVAELAYIVADLESADNRLAARSTQPVLLKSHSATLWRVLSAPLHWAGLLSDARVVSVKVFSNYIEQRNIPFACFKLTVKSRSETSPRVLSATVRVHLHVGVVRRMLYHLRPHSLIALSMGAGAVCATVGGSIGAVLCIAVLLYTVVLRSKQHSGSGSDLGSDGRPGSSASVDLTIESGSDLLGASNSAGTTPRHLDLSEEDEGGDGSVGGSPSPSPKEERPWQILLKQIPFPSPQRQNPVITGYDIPFVRSETAATGAAVGGGSGRTELGAAGMRYRGGADPFDAPPQDNS